MTKMSQTGAINALLIPFIVIVLLLIATGVFGGWAYSSRQDYKNNVDAKISSAVAAAKQQEDVVDQAHFAAEQKLPLLTYAGPEQYGSFVTEYPRTWSAYVDNSGQSNNNGSSSFDAYFYPRVVPSTDTTNVIYALRISVLNQTYATTMQSFTQAQAGTVSVAAYSFPKVPSVVGAEVTGQIETNTTGTMIVVPLRTQTLEVWTEGSQFVDDFNSSVLPNFTFSP